jgi:GNAT superfamily N-acetyltransferase
MSCLSNRMEGEEAVSHTSPCIRRRREEDLQGAAEALIAVHRSDGYPVEGVDDPVEWLKPTGAIRSWVAEMDGRIVGHVSVSAADGEAAGQLWSDKSGIPLAGVATLGRLFVLREARRHSIGELLVRAASAYAHEKGLRLTLDVMTKDVAAIRLYERLGWTQIGRTVHRYGDGQEIDAVCYVSPAQ